MLQFLRSKAGSLAARVLFVALLGSFGIWGIGDFLRQRPRDTTLITVNDRKISPDELHNAVQRELTQFRETLHEQISMDEARRLGIVDRTVDALIGRALLDQVAEAQDLPVGDEQILKTIQSNPAFQEGGHFDTVVFRTALAAHGMNEGQFFASLREELPTSALSGIATTETAPATLVDILFKIRNEKRVADWVFLPASGVKDIPTPTPADLTAFYDKHHGMFTAPEYRTITVLPMRQSDLAATINPTEEQISDAYQQHVGDFTDPEQRHVFNLLLPDEATANEAVKQIEGGKDPLEVAKTLGKQDPGSVDLGFVKKADLPAAVADPAFAAKDGEVVKPFKATFGWTVIKIAGVKPGHVKTLEEAKPELVTAVRDELAGDALYKRTNNVEDALAAGATLEAVAQQEGLTPVKIAAIDAQGNGPDQKPVADLPVPAASLLKLAFETAQGQISTVQEVPEAKLFFVLRVDQVTAPALRPFDQVSAKVRDAWTADQQSVAVADQAKKLRDAVKPDNPLSKLAAASKLDLNTTAPVERTAPESEKGPPAALISELFTVKVGDAVSTGTDKGQYVAQLKEIQEADPNTDKVERDRVNKVLAEELSGERFTQFTLALRQRATVTINKPEIDRLFAASTP
jgi:peptidyl-prolyl cis-trans isomerase D